MVILTSSVQYDSHIINKFLQECAKLLIMCCEHGEVQHNFFGVGSKIGKVESNKKQKLLN
jgi:hypothetical protein